jgi:hypothetical protein
MTESDRPPVSGEPRICPVRIHHGPGHQSTTNCMVMEPHEVHRAEYGSYGGYAEWRGGDVFGDDGYEDDPDGWQPTYISDMTWYDRNSPYGPHDGPHKIGGSWKDRSEAEARATPPSLDATIRRIIQRFHDGDQWRDGGNHPNSSIGKCGICSHILDEERNRFTSKEER